MYNDEGYKIYEGKIKDWKYIGYGIEYSNYIKDMILYKGCFSIGNYIYNQKYFLRILKSFLSYII